MKASNGQNIGNVHHVAHGVYIGGARAVYLVPALRRAGVTRVLKLYDHIPDWPQDLLVCENPLEDGVFVPREVLQRGVSFVRQQVEVGEVENKTSKVYSRISDHLF